MLDRQERKEKKRVRNSSMSTKAREEGGEEAGAETPLQPLEEPTLEQRSELWPAETSHWSRFFSCRTAAHGRTHTGAEEKYQIEGEAERICYGLTVLPHPSLHCSGGGWSSLK